MIKISKPFKNIHNWVEDHFIAGLTIGVVLLLPIISGILYQIGFTNELQLWVRQNLEDHDYFALTITLTSFYGSYLLLWSLYSSLKKGNRVTEFAFGSILSAVGFAIIVSTFPYLGSWAQSLEGTGIKFGALLIPGVVLIVLVPGIGLIIGGFGIYRAVRAFLPVYKALRGLYKPPTVYELRDRKDIKRLWKKTFTSKEGKAAIRALGGMGEEVHPFLTAILQKPNQTFSGGLNSHRNAQRVLLENTKGEVHNFLKNIKDEDKDVRDWVKGQRRHLISEKTR